MEESDLEVIVSVTVTTVWRMFMITDISKCYRSLSTKEALPSWERLPKGNNTDVEGNGTPLQYSCLENPMDGGAWQAAVHGVAKSWTRLSDFTFTFHFHALEKEMATNSSVLAWRIPGMVEPGGLLSMGSHRVGHDWSDLAAAAAATLINKNTVSHEKWPGHSVLWYVPIVFMYQKPQNMPFEYDFYICVKTTALNSTARIQCIWAQLSPSRRNNMKRYWNQ